MTYYYSWNHVRYIVDKVHSDGIPGPREYDTLKDICSTVSEGKRKYLYKGLQGLLSPGSMYYLFGDYDPEAAAKERKALAVRG